MNELSVFLEYVKDHKEWEIKEEHVEDDVNPYIELGYLKNPDDNYTFCLDILYCTDNDYRDFVEAVAPRGSTYHHRDDWIQIQLYAPVKNEFTENYKLSFDVPKDTDPEKLLNYVLSLFGKLNKVFSEVGNV